MFKKTIAILGTLLTLSLAGTVFAQTTTTTASATAKIVCVGAAVATRETTLDTGMTTYTGALNSAYGARATALASAYAKTSTTDVRAGIKSAWTTFDTSTRSAQKAWQSTRINAWAKFRTASASCKAPSIVSDSANSVSEMSGE